MFVGQKIGRIEILARAAIQMILVIIFKVAVFVVLLPLRPFGLQTGHMRVGMAAFPFLLMQFGPSPRHRFAVHFVHRFGLFVRLQKIAEASFYSANVAPQPMLIVGDSTRSVFGRNIGLT